jgi:hypothetical protein
MGIYIFFIVLLVILVIIIYFYYTQPYDIIKIWNSCIEQQISPIFLTPDESNVKSFHDDLIAHYDCIKDEIMLNYEKGHAYESN